MRQFDEAYTAPFFGFANATDYYHRASALRVVDRISVPALIITPKTIRLYPPTVPRSGLAANPDITLIVTTHGGHCGFVGR